MTKRAQSEHRQVASFDLGRTQQKRVHICGKHGETFLASVYTSVNIQESPELREPLFEGSLNSVVDPGDDGRTYHLAVPLVYHDPERKIFGLIIPDGLRHQEFACRQELLAELARSEQVLPAYMRRFEVFFELDELLELEKEKEKDGGEEATLITEVTADFQERDQLLAQIKELEEQTQKLQQQIEAAAHTEIEAESKVDPELEAALHAREEELLAREEALNIDRQQLQEVASRIERESARVDEARQTIQQEQAHLAQLREELETERRRVQVMELNLEQARLRLEQSTPAIDYVEDKTQVVTDDQFIEIVEQEVVVVEEQVASMPASVLPERFPAPPQSQGPFFTAVINDQPVVGFALPDARAKNFQNGNLDIVFQLHRVDETPLIALALLAFDSDGTLLDAVAAPVIDRTPQESEFLNILAAERHVELGIYDDEDRQIFSWKAEVNGIGNLGWARFKSREWQNQTGEKGAAAAERAAALIAAGEIELWGTMRHPFHPESFAELSSASEVQLAVGILEYWSMPEQIEYLVGNRAFPVQLFIEIQKRVIRQALHWGIVPGKELQELAIEEAIIPDAMSLTQRLLANFAELCIGIRPNDLDPLEQWENWEALIQLAERTGVHPDPDVLELAEISLKRAQEFEEQLDNEHEEEWEDFSEDLVMETFEDLESLERDDLIGLLSDHEGRLEAAQLLVARYGSEVLDEILIAAEEMNTAQIEALSRTFVANAKRVEKGLVQSIKGCGPAALYLGAQALRAAGNNGVLPELIEAARQPASKNDQERLANALVKYGDELLAPLTQALRKSPQDTNLIAILIAFEQVRKGTLKELQQDRDKNIQKAVENARAAVKELEES